MTTKYILSRQECLARGGHVWEEGITSLRINLDIFSRPTQEHPEYRSCKYCGYTEIGYYPPIIWEPDEEAQ